MTNRFGPAAGPLLADGNLRGRLLLLAALLACTFLTALDVLVVSTATPTIVGQLGGLSLYSWVFSSFLLASTVTVPVYGKLADIYGRKPIFTLGTVIFLLGSVLCGMAQDMTQLIMFRAIQGLGAGAVFPLTLTIVGDVFSLEERARIVGLFSAVWGVAGICGPLIGGFLTDNLSWRWIFFLNLPVGAVALPMLWMTLKENVKRRKHQIDYVGAVMLTIALTILMLGLLEAGSVLPGISPVGVGLLAGALILLAIFAWYERRVPEPVLPMQLLERRLILVAGVCAFASGVINSGVATFGPVFTQGVLGGTATMAGMILMPTAFTWPAGTFLSGRLLMKFSYRPTAVFGTAVIAVGAAVFTVLSEESPIWWMLAGVGLIGLGMGLSTAMLTIAVQNSVPWEQRGVATSSYQFFRSIGQAVGVTVFGAVFNLMMARQLAAAGQDQAISNRVLDPLSRAAIDPAVLDTIRGALDSSIHAVFVLAFAITLVNVIASVQLPGGSAQELAWKPDDESDVRGTRVGEAEGAPL